MHLLLLGNDDCESITGLSLFWFAGDHWETIRMGSESKTLPETLAALFAPAEPPPLPERLTPKVLREAIARVLERVSANELANECVRFGLLPEEEGEDGPWRGKYRYVERRMPLAAPRAAHARPRRRRRLR